MAGLSGHGEGHEENSEESDKVVVHKAIKYLFKAMIGSSMSTIVIFVPFMLMTGVAGAYFKVMTNTMIITLICSFLATWQKPNYSLLCLVTIICQTQIQNA